MESYMPVALEARRRRDFSPGQHRGWFRSAAGEETIKSTSAASSAEEAACQAWVIQKLSTASVDNS
jgi:hypothetical protein